MAKQVKPFESPICLGYMVWCDYEDGETAPEPEGTVFFDSEPKIGDLAKLSDGKTYRVKREANERMEITMSPAD